MSAPLTWPEVVNNALIIPFMLGAIYIVLRAFR